MNPLALYVEIAPGGDEQLADDRLRGATGLVADAGSLQPEQLGGFPAPVGVMRLRGGEMPPQWRHRGASAWACDAGLERTAALRDLMPELRWIPRLEVYKPEVTYRFNALSHGDGFKFYVPDTASLRSYRSVGGGSLGEALAQARALDFPTLWLHARHAAEAGKGLDLELLAYARQRFTGNLWLSGGATAARHLLNLAREGGAAAVVVSSRLAILEGCERLGLALADGAETGVPIAFGVAPAARSARGT